MKPKVLLIVIGSMLVAAAVLVPLTVAAVTFSLPRIYYACARILVQHGQAAAEPAVSTSTMSGRDLLFLNDQIEIIRSRKIIGLVAEREALIQKWAISGSDVSSKEQVFQLVRSRLNVCPVRNSHLIEVGIYSTNPEESADLANATAIAYRDTITRAPFDHKVEIIDKAISPKAHCKPNVPVYLLCGFGVGGLFGLVGIIAIVVGCRQSSQIPPPLPTR